MLVVVLVVLFVALFPLQPLTPLWRRVFLAATRLRIVALVEVAAVAETAETAVEESRAAAAVATRQPREGNRKYRVRTCSVVTSRSDTAHVRVHSTHCHLADDTGTGNKTNGRMDVMAAGVGSMLCVPQPVVYLK